VVEWHGSLTPNNVETVVVYKAKALADQVTTMRNFYTQQVVSPAKTGGMRIDYDWDVTPNSLPLPATFTNELDQHIKKRKHGYGHSAL